MAAELSDTTLETWRAFLGAHALMIRRIERALAEQDLPPLGWYDVLWAVRSAPGQRLRIRDLADAVVLSPTGMSRMVERLVQAGCCAASPCPATAAPPTRRSPTPAGPRCARCGLSTRAWCASTSSRASRTRTR